MLIYSKRNGSPLGKSMNRSKLGNNSTMQQSLNSFRSISSPLMMKRKTK